MKHSTSTGNSNPCPALKSLTNVVGGMLCLGSTANRYKRLDAKLERKMIELRRRSSGKKSFRSINTIIMRFPQLKEELRNIRDVFEQYDEDGNGTIDPEELNKCLKKLHVNLTKQEIDDLFHSCDADRSGGIQFNEFIVLLCLVYLLTKPTSSLDTLSRTGSPQLEAAFDKIVDAFFFMDNNGDGKVNKKDMVKALNGPPWEKSPAHVARSRFKEMDMDKNGNVSFREFLFALTSWLGIDSDEEILVGGD